MSELIVSVIGQIHIDIYCGCYIEPPSLCGGDDGDECDWGTSLIIEKDLWDDGFMCWCPVCGAELADGYGMEQVNQARGDE